MALWWSSSRLWAPNEEDLGPIPGQGTIPHMLQIKDSAQCNQGSHVLQLRPGTAEQFFFFKKDMENVDKRERQEGKTSQCQTVMESYGIQAFLASQTENS